MDAITDHGSTVVLHVSGRQFDKFLSVSFSRSVEGVVGQATLTLPFTNTIRLNTLVEKRARLVLHFSENQVHQKPLMTGYVKRATVVHRSQGPLITLVVKDKIVDLQECHPITEYPKFGDVETSAFFNPALITPPNFVAMNIGSIAKAFCTPFGIQVVDSSFNITPFSDNVVVEQTETVLSQIVDLCKIKGAVPFCNANGDLVVGQLVYEYRTNRTDNVPHSHEYMETATVRSNPGEVWNTISEADVLEFEHDADFTNRFSDYKVMYNQLEEGSPLGNGIEGIQWSQDGAVRRWRPKVLRPDLSYKGDRDKFAQWISRTQRGTSNNFTIKLRYWYKIHNGSARIFEIGDLLKLDLPNWGYRGELVITGVNYQLDGNGARTLTVNLKSKDTYALVPDSTVHFGVANRAQPSPVVQRERVTPDSFLIVGEAFGPQPLAQPEIAQPVSLTESELQQYVDEQNGVLPVRYKSAYEYEQNGLNPTDQLLFEEFYAE